MLRLCSEHRRAHDLNISPRARRVCPGLEPLEFVSGECSSTFERKIINRIGRLILFQINPIFRYSISFVLTI